MELSELPSNKKQRSIGKSFLKSAGFALLGFAATAIPLQLLLRRELRDASDDIREQGWPIRLLQVIFAKYIVQWIDVEGIENLPNGSYLIAANHAYKSGVDGFILGHLVAARAQRIPRILMTSEARNWMVRAERWLLHHYGVALLVHDETGVRQKSGLSDTIANYLRESSKHAVLIFPAGRAIADPAMQLKNWSTGVVIAAEKSGCPIVPIAVGGLRLDWSPETVIFSALESEGAEPPFHFHVRIGKPIEPTGDAYRDLELLRTAVAELMQTIPGLRPAPGEFDPGFGKITLRDGRTLAYMDRGPRTGTPVLYFHGFQGSRLERVPDIDAILMKLNVRMISPDRPGIGLSTPAHARTVVSWASDVRQLTDQLLGENQPFSILGFSAGATYALACGQLPGLQSISLVSGMGLPHMISSWRRYSEDARNILLSAKLAHLRAATFLLIEKKQRDKIFGDWPAYIKEIEKGMSPDDARLVSKPEVEDLFRENRREGYGQCPGCLLQEVQALYSDPHIDLTHLAACKVSLIHGTEDKVVPIAVARDLHHRIPDSTLTELSGRGHYFIYDRGEMENILGQLLDFHQAAVQDSIAALR